MLVLWQIEVVVWPMKWPI